MAALPFARITRLVLLLVALETLMVLAFAWPATRTAPRDVPVLVAGPPAAVAAVGAAVRSGHGAALALTPVADEAAARSAIASRRAYGALLVGPGRPRVLVASAASPAVAQLLTAFAASDPAGPAVVEDVAPAPVHDPRGGFLAAGLLPVVMTSVAAGVVLLLLVRPVGRRLAALLALAAAAGACVSAVGHLLGALAGPPAAEAGVVALGVLAVTGMVSGAGALLGRPAAAAAAAVMMLVGNPLSAAASAPELLPRPWGGLGTLLPPGALVQAVRSVSFFDGAGGGKPLAVLAVWAAAGLLLAFAAGRRTALAPTPSPTARVSSGAVPAAG